MTESFHRRSVRLAIVVAIAGLSWGCASGAAGSACGNDFDCGNSLFCNGSGVCQQSAVSCTSAADCGPNQNCSAGVCLNGCRTDGCPANQICNRALDLCVTLVIDLNGGETSGGEGNSTGALTSSTGATGGTAGMGTSSSGATAGAESSSGTSTGSTATPTTGGATSASGGSSGGSGTGTGGGTTTGGACTPDSWASFAGAFFTTYCGQCHNWTRLAVAQDGQIASELEKGFMPPRTAKVQPSPQDLNRILTWISCGEP